MATAPGSDREEFMERLRMLREDAYKLKYVSAMAGLSILNSVMDGSKQTKMRYVTLMTIFADAMMNSPEGESADE
jgi:hypothetical protein